MKLKKSESYLEEHRKQYGILNSHINSLNDDEKLVFEKTVDNHLFTLPQYIKIVECIRKGFDPKVIANASYSVDTMEIIMGLLEDGLDIDNIKCLFRYPSKTVISILNYYNRGNNIIPFIVNNDSYGFDFDEYLEMLFYCCDNKIDFNCILKYDTNTRRDLLCCLILGYDVTEILDIEELSSEIVGSDDLITNKLIEKSSYNVYIVKCDNADYEECDSYTIIACSEKDAKLYSCVSGGFSPLHVSVESYSLNSKNSGIIHSSTR